MRAIKIDPYDKTITEIDVAKITNSLKHLYTAMGHGVHIVERSTWTLKSAEIWLDEDGLRRGHPYFQIKGEQGTEDFTGPAIILGRDGRKLPDRYTTDSIRSIVRFQA